MSQAAEGTDPARGHRGATRAEAHILQSQISESESAGEVASAAGVIQFNKPEVARDRKPGGRGPPPPNPAFPAQSGCHGKPRLPAPPRLRPAAEESGFLRCPPRPPQSAAPPPAQLATRAPKARAASLSLAPGYAKPLLWPGPLRKSAQSSAPRGSGRSFQAAAPLGKGNLTLLWPAGTEGGEGGEEEGTAGAGSVRRPGARAPAPASGGAASGFPELSDPWNKEQPLPQCWPHLQGPRGSRGLGAPPRLPASGPRRPGQG